MSRTVDPQKTVSEIILSSWIRNKLEPILPGINNISDDRHVLAIGAFMLGGLEEVLRDIGMEIAGIAFRLSAYPIPLSAIPKTFEDEIKSNFPKFKELKSIIASKLEEEKVKVFSWVVKDLGGLDSMKPSDVLLLANLLSFGDKRFNQVLSCWWSIPGSRKDATEAAIRLHLLQLASHLFKLAHQRVYGYALLDSGLSEKDVQLFDSQEQGVLALFLKGKIWLDQFSGVEEGITQGLPDGELSPALAKKVASAFARNSSLVSAVESAIQNDPVAKVIVNKLGGLSKIQETPLDFLRISRLLGFKNSDVKEKLKPLLNEKNGHLKLEGVGSAVFDAKLRSELIKKLPEDQVNTIESDQLFPMLCLLNGGDELMAELKKSSYDILTRCRDSLINAYFPDALVAEMRERLNQRYGKDIVTRVVDAETAGGDRSVLVRRLLFLYRATFDASGIVSLSSAPKNLSVGLIRSLNRYEEKLSGEVFNLFLCELEKSKEAKKLSGKRGPGLFDGSKPQSGSSVDSHPENSHKPSAAL